MRQRAQSLDMHQTERITTATYITRQWFGEVPLPCVVLFVIGASRFACGMRHAFVSVGDVQAGQLNDLVIRGGGRRRASWAARGPCASQACAPATQPSPGQA